jgi:EAL domain-containing protein (putative c-di-GMP-specific phosphodiesterase class I)
MAPGATITKRYGGSAAADEDTRSRGGREDMTLIGRGGVLTGESQNDTDPDELEAAIFTALADPEQPRLVFQPIVDLQCGDVVGYETLSRFVSPLSASPDRWFEAASRLGVGARLQADVVRRVIETLPTLPGDTFLSVNLDPKLVTAPEIADLLTHSGRLDRLVIELTEQTVARDVRTMLTLLDEAREFGAIVAIDESGAGYGSLRNLVTVRPELVKLDRSLVTWLDRDVVRRSMVDMLGHFVGRMGARLVAEGLEAPSELHACVDLRVPLGQGWLLGRPSDEWQLSSPASVIEEIRARARLRDATDTLVPLVDPVPAVASRDEAIQLLERQRAVEHVVIVNDDRHPTALLTRLTCDRGDTLRSTLLIARATERVSDVSARAAVRDAETRFDPVVCRDEHGCYKGVVTVDRLLNALAARDMR